MTPNQSHVAGLEFYLSTVEVWSDKAVVLRDLIARAQSAPEPVQGEAAHLIVERDIMGTMHIKMPVHDDGEPFDFVQVQYRYPYTDNQSTKRLADQIAQLIAGGANTAAANPGWREHSRHIAKGEKCPETIETLQAAWDRDQELINDMRHEIARHKTRINRLEQRRTAKPDAELVALLAECRGIVAKEVERWNKVAAFLLEDGSVKSGLLARIDAKLASLK